MKRFLIVLGTLLVFGVGVLVGVRFWPPFWPPFWLPWGSPTATNTETKGGEEREPAHGASGYPEEADRRTSLNRRRSDQHHFIMSADA